MASQLRDIADGLASVESTHKVVRVGDVRREAAKSRLASVRGRSLRHMMRRKPKSAAAKSPRPVACRRRPRRERVAPRVDKLLRA